MVVENLYWWAADLIRTRGYGAVLLLITTCLFTSCQNLKQQAIQSGDLQPITIVGKELNHSVYVKGEPNPGNTLLVYIEGDGQPFLPDGKSISADPTSTKPLMLELMLEDDMPAVYLGRPCYDGQATSAICHPWLWTHGRYSKLVVESMLLALEKIKEKFRIQDTVLIGHSGGGTLAVLMAANMPDVTAVITMAGNLDTDAWVAEHNYSPLQGSLNPIDAEPLDKSIKQFHYVGGKDQVINAEHVKAFASKQSNANYFLLDGVDHWCCWSTAFPDILDRL